MKTGYKDFVVKSGRSREYFLSLLVMSAHTSTSLLGRMATRTIIGSQKNYWKGRFYEIGLDFAVVCLVGHEYAEHGRNQWCGGHCVRYHTYLISENYDQPDATAFAYRDSFHVGSRANAQSVKKVSCREEADVNVMNS